jgi:hypothetical protein
MDYGVNIERWRYLHFQLIKMHIIWIMVYILRGGDESWQQGLNQAQGGMDPMCTEVDGMSGHSNKQGMCMFKTVQTQDESQFTPLTVQIKRTVSLVLVQ